MHLKSNIFIHVCDFTYNHSTVQVASHILDRVYDISRFFPVVLDVGCGRGHIAKLMPDKLINSLYQCDMAEKAVVSIKHVDTLFSSISVNNFYCISSNIRNVVNV